MNLKSPCYRCHKQIPPVNIKPIDKENRTPNPNPKNVHSCQHPKCKKKNGTGKEKLVYLLLKYL